jgi:YggT family protein
MILLYRSITILLNLIELLILVRIIFSFLNIRGENIVIKFVYELTEPVLGTARNLLDKIGIKTGMFDFSPLVAILFLRIIYNLAGRILL